MRLGVAAAVLLLSAACGGRSSDPEAVRIVVPYDVRTLDPHARDTLSNLAVAAHVYEPLVTMDGSFRIHPCLARLWENPDRSTWVFHLRPGVRFHGGRPLRADDVVYSIRRLLADPKLEISAYVAFVTEATALDPLTVRIRTTRPPSLFLSKLRFVAVVPEGASPAQLAAGADGTGPYRLTRWKARESVELERNEDYWGPPPALSRVELLLNRGAQDAAEALLTGGARIGEIAGRVAEERIRSDARFEVLKAPSLFLKFLGFDLHRQITPGTDVRPNPFLRKAVRQAIHLALDRPRLVTGLATDAVPAAQLVPSSYVFGFNPSAPRPVLDRDGAREKLREAGLAKGFRATLHVRRLFPEAAHLVRDQLREVGIELEVRVLGDEEFFDLAQKGDLSFYLTRIGSGTGDASDILESALHSSDPAHGFGGSNYSRYSNPEVDRAIEESGLIDEDARRREAIDRLMARVMDDLPWVPLYIDQHVYAVDRRLAWRPRGDNVLLAAEVGFRR